MLELVKVNPEDISDVDISDISDIETESESENDDNPLEENENGDRCAWREMLRNVDVEDFTGTPGLTRTLDATAEEIDFFNIMFPVFLYEIIARETNRYAEQEQEKNGVDPRWRATTPEEIRAYIAIQIVMGIIVAPNQDMYFTKVDLFRPMGINDRMTRDRLDKLNQYFHVADTTQNPPRRQPGHDKLAHLRPIMDILLQQTKQEYSPHKETSVDEAMVAYTGRLGFKQYVPLKPTK